MIRSLGILIFDGAEELDFVGPWEVFTMAAKIAQDRHREPPFAPVLIAPSSGPVRCAKGMRVLADTTIGEVSSLDILLVPGGQGTRREVHNPELLAWIAKISQSAQWVTSVCTGALLLTAAGPARGKTVTTHWAFVETLAARGEAARVVDDQRYVVDGNLATAAGVSAGIDMALWLTCRLCGAEFAALVKRGMQYEPEPPV